MARTDPFALFLHAEAFHSASSLLRPERDAAPERLAPYIANRVFALELYLKCLLMCVKGKYPQLHSVQALFFDLPEDEIARVRKLHRSIFRLHWPRPDESVPARRKRASRGAPSDPEADARLDAILAGAKDAFTTARYLYEREGASDEGIPDVTPVIVCVRGRILAMNPGWAAG